MTDWLCTVDIAPRTPRFVTDEVCIATHPTPTPSELGFEYCRCCCCYYCCLHFIRHPLDQCWFLLQLATPNKCCTGAYLCCDLFLRWGLWWSLAGLQVVGMATGQHLATPVAGQGARSS